MADERPDRLAPLRELTEAADDTRVLDLLAAIADVLEKDTALILEQVHIARDIAARTKAGDWFGNTELAEIMSDADHFLGVYKQQREGIRQMQEAMQAERTRLSAAEKA